MHVSNPVDSIFGLRGLPALQKYSLPRPRYDVAEWRVFSDVYRDWQGSNANLDMLYNATRYGPWDDYPSWVPDWSKRFLFTLPILSPASTFMAAGTSRAIFRVSTNGDVLEVFGRKLDIINQVSVVHPDRQHTLRNALYDCTNAVVLARDWLTNRNDGSSLATLEKTFTWDMTLRSYKRGMMQAEFREWYEYMLLHCNAYDVVMEEYIEKKFAIFPFIVKTALCTTENARLASIVTSVQSGDQIVILSGGALPFVLRANGQNYNLVGYCYIDGVMNGEEYAEDMHDLEWFPII